MGPELWGPGLKGGGLEEARKVGRPKFRALFFPATNFFPLLGVLAWNLSGVFEVLALSCKAPAAHYPTYCSRAGPRALTDVYPAMHEDNME